MENFDKITAGVTELAGTFDGKLSMINDAAFKVKGAFGSVFNEALKAHLTSYQQHSMKMKKQY